MNVVALFLAWLRSLLVRLCGRRYPRAAPDARLPAITVEDLLPNAEQLRNVAYSSLSGDPAARPVGRHGRRALARPDTTGATKEGTYDAVLGFDVHDWEAMASTIRRMAASGTWPRSRRSFESKDGGGTRPIDDPVEVKRLVALFVRVKIGKRIDDALTSRQFGGRTSASYPHLCIHGGATVQDHLATGLHHSIFDGRSKILLIDLKNAFGLVPRKAALEALKNLGLDDRAARFVWNLVRINSEDSNGDVVPSDPRWGIEQGNCLSAAIMNLVLAPLLRQIEAEFDVEAWAFVDDIYITMRPGQDGTEVFRAFRRNARGAGFNNVRRLWSPADGERSKNSKIVDTTVEPIRVLKTYDIDALGISLAREKIEKLRARGLNDRTSLKQIRRDSECLALTGKAMRARTSLLRRSKPNSDGERPRTEETPTERPRTREREEGRDPRAKPHGTPEGKLQCPGEDQTQVEDKAGGVQRLHETATDTSRGRRAPRSGKGMPDQSQGGADGTTGPEPHRERETSTRSQGCQDELPGADGGSFNLEESVDPKSPGGEGEQPAGGVHPPADSPFFPFDQPEIVKLLRAGGRLRLGDGVKGRVLSLVGLEAALGGALAVSQGGRVAATLMRAVRRNRGVHVLYDPCESWTRCAYLFGREGDRAYQCVRMAPIRGDQLVEVELELRRANRRYAKRHALPEVGHRGLLVHEVRMVSHTRREVEVRYTAAGRHSREIMRVPTPVSEVAKLHAVAQLVASRPFVSVAIRRAGSLRAADPAPVSHVGISRASKLLRQGRTWRRSGAWLVGSPVAPEKRDPPDQPGRRKGPVEPV